MLSTTCSWKQVLTGLSSFVFLLVLTTFQSCQKTKESLPEGMSQAGQNTRGKKPKDPPPPPPPFYFTNCNNPTYSAAFTKGVAANTAIVKNYVNRPGGSYGAFTASLNGITISAPAGTFN